MSSAICICSFVPVGYSNRPARAIRQTNHKHFICLLLVAALVLGDIVTVENGQYAIDVIEIRPKKVHTCAWTDARGAPAARERAS